MATAPQKGASPPNDPYEIALGRIADVVQSGDSVLVLEDLGLDRIPAEIAQAETVSALHMKGNMVTDLSPLAGLTNLRYLYIARNFVRDLTPVETLTNLDTIDCTSNHVQSLTPLLKCTKLVEIYASTNKIEAVGELAELSKLSVLDISYNEVQDITALMMLSGLRQLYVNDNKIQSIQFVPVIASLERLAVGGNPLRPDQVDALKDLTSLTELSIDRLGLTRLPTELLALPNLTFIDLIGNPIPDIQREDLDNLAALRKHANIAERNTKEEKGAQQEQKAAEPDDLTEVQSPVDTETGEGPEPIAGYSGTGVNTKLMYIRSAPDEVLLSVPEQAGIFAEILQNAEGGSEEQFFGLFGRWGRGKSFFWNETQSYLEEHHPEEFEFVELHAWKYQDTTAVWAYLYELLVKQYYDKPGMHPGWHFWKFYRGSWWTNLRKWMQYQGRKLRLNWQRGATQREIIGAAGSLLAGITTWWLGDVFTGGADNYVPQSLLSIFVGLSSFVFGVRELRKRYGTEARNLIQAATENASFSDKLGFQHEVQAELKNLIRMWMERPRLGHKKQRLMLFIDDIDRCSEDKIIRIVDAVRVMLHDPLIRKRVVVVAAIDERILLRAIKNKYANSSSDEVRDQLSREYMDKLFIAGLRLGPLSEGEKDEIFDGFTRNITNPLPRIDRLNVNSVLAEPAIGPVDEDQDANGTGVVLPSGVSPEGQSGGTIPDDPTDAARDGTWSHVLHSRFEASPIELTPANRAVITEAMDRAWPMLAPRLDSTEHEVWQSILADVLVRFAPTASPSAFQQYYNNFAESVARFRSGAKPDGTEPFVLKSETQVRTLCDLFDAVETAVAWMPMDSPWELELEESKFLKDCLDFYSDPTPRNIRVFTIRFLLAKKLMERELHPSLPGWEEWHHSFAGKHWFALKLIEYSSVKGPVELDNLLRTLENSKETTTVDVCFGQPHEWPTVFVSKCLKILAMVVAY